MIDRPSSTTTRAIARPLVRREAQTSPSAVWPYQDTQLREHFKRYTLKSIGSCRSFSIDVERPPPRPRLSTRRTLNTQWRVFDAGPRGSAESSRSARSASTRCVYRTTPKRSGCASARRATTQCTAAAGDSSARCSSRRGGPGQTHCVSARSSGAARPADATLPRTGRRW